MMELIRHRYEFSVHQELASIIDESTDWKTKCDRIFMRYGNYVIENFNMHGLYGHEVNKEEKQKPITVYKISDDVWTTKDIGSESKQIKFSNVILARRMSDSCIIYMNLDGSSRNK